MNTMQSILRQLLLQSCSITLFISICIQINQYRL